MRVIEGTIDGHPLKVHIPETLVEYREGARLLNSTIKPNEGILFNFRKADRIVLENSSVTTDLLVLYFDSFFSFGLVKEIASLNANSVEPISSINIHTMCLELNKEWAESLNLKVGSFLNLKEKLS